MFFFLGSLFVILIHLPDRSHTMISSRGAFVRVSSQVTMRRQVLSLGTRSRMQIADLKPSDVIMLDVPI